MSEQNTQTVGEQYEKKPRGRGLFVRLTILLIVLVIALIVLQGTYFRLSKVYVFGNDTVTAQEVAVASGLVEGLNMLSINEKEVAKRMTSNHRFEFIRLEKAFPDTINLYIRERKPVSVIQWLGVQYTLDKDGMVMTERNELDLPGDKIYVTGLMIMNIHVGLDVETSDSRQLSAYSAILNELDMQYYLDQISEMNIKDLESIYLVTRDGIIVRMGDGSNAKAKVCAMRTDLAYLRQLGKTSGLLDVSQPEDAKYTPES